MNLQTLDNGSSVCPDDPGEPTTGVRRVSVTEREAEFLTWLARGKKALEIGTGLGVSTLALLKSALFVATLDIDPWVHDHIWPTMHGEIECYHDRAKLAQSHGFDLVFVDGAHDTDSARQDIEFAEYVIYDDGVIVVHDWKIPEVRAALDDSFALIDTHHGMAVKFVGWG
jgi:predicted O-methyltransferase YrrM